VTRDPIPAPLRGLIVQARPIPAQRDRWSHPPAHASAPAAATSTSAPTTVLLDHRLDDAPRTTSQPLVVWDPRTLGYHPGGSHPMAALRWQLTWELASALGVIDGFRVVTPEPADAATLGLVPLPTGWLAHAATASPGTPLPEDMSDGTPHPVPFRPWDGGIEQPVDRAIQDTRTAVYPLHGLDPYDPRD